MAMFDFGGGCACGLRRECDCENAHKHLEAIMEPTPFLFWLYDNMPISSVSCKDRVYTFYGKKHEKEWMAYWVEPADSVRRYAQQGLIQWRELGASVIGLVMLSAEAIAMIKKHRETENRDRAEWERLRKKYGDK